ncbi:response regulator transcription factor [Ornithinicoccus hortensis]|uniref:DNA-binding response OmpR family regulator n=1 Tax=Ornithinicoccus hortensis TaxID=82346 RepID=A0A542YM83_9MICO|nr:response regulator transcription factor [Ornithinicoccus hortensis]TQL49193.1 DNA-binding response OmpR family regulator [Ornithinicoccus hortensis]
MATILIAEDEERIARFMEKGLRAAGFQTTVVGDGMTALEYAANGGYDLLVLDVGLPRMDGFTVLKVLRSMEHNLPIIMCTARDAVEDTVAGLEGGADDYLAKPFKFEELLARVRTRLRTKAAPEATTVLSQGDLSLDITTRIATVAGREVELSAREFAMAREFLEHPGQVLSREQLLSRVWGYDFDVSSNVVDVYVRYLRTKLGADRIATVRGVGYRLTVE